MLENIKSAIYQRLEELFAVAAVDELTSDTKAYTEKLNTIAAIADALGIETELTVVQLNLKEPPQ